MTIHMKEMKMRIKVMAMSLSLPPLHTDGAVLVEHEMALSDHLARRHREWVRTYRGTTEDGTSYFHIAYPSGRSRWYTVAS